MAGLDAEKEITLILDIEHGDTSVKERGISVASSLAERFLHRGVSVSLAANGRSCIGGREIRVPAGSGAAHLRIIDDSLAQRKLGQATRSTEALLEALRRALTEPALRERCAQNIARFYDRSALRDPRLDAIRRAILG